MLLSPMTAHAPISSFELTISKKSNPASVRILSSYFKSICHFAVVFCDCFTPWIAIECYLLVQSVTGNFCESCKLKASSFAICGMRFSHYNYVHISFSFAFLLCAAEKTMNWERLLSAASSI